MPTEKPSLLTIREAANLLGVHPETLRRWDNDAKLKAIRVGKRGHRRYRQEDIKELYEKSDKLDSPKG